MRRLPLQPITECDVAVGYPIGDVPEPGEGSRRPQGDPRTALERAIQTSLERPPCIVGFSGGRDSSAILALAVHVARLQGLPLPVPVTRRFLDAPESDENWWQETVIRHLGVEDWIREEIRDELDIVGPLAQQRLQRYGVIWSPLIHGDEYLLRYAAGGSIIDGEGGDEVLDPEPHRVLPLARVVRYRRMRNPSRFRAAAGTLLPRHYRARRAVLRARAAEPLQPWLRPEVLAEVQREYALWQASQPLDARRSIMRVVQRRSGHILTLNRRAIAGDRNVDLRSPFLDRSVVVSVAVAAGALGYRNRAAALELICGDLLPADVIGRRSKASFGSAVIRRHTREFVESWSGGGLNSDLVDPEFLHRAWQQPRVNAMSTMLLQTAWLHDHRRST